MNSSIIYSAIPGIFGIIAIIIGIQLIIRKRKFIRNSIKKKGIVVGVEKMRRRSGLLSPVVEFTDNGGNKVRFSSSIYRTEIPQKEGDRVDVLYDPVSDKMELAENAGGGGVGLIIPFALCILGAFFLLSSIIFSLLL